MDAPTRSQLDDVLRLVLTTLDPTSEPTAPTVLGAYLHGSAVLGELRPRSDLDVLVVARRSLTSDERRTLLSGLLDVSGQWARRVPGRPVELTIVVQSDVRPWRYPPRADFLYGEWRRDDYEAGVVPVPEPTPDLAPLLTMALRGNAALAGPPPAQVLDPVPHTDVLRAIVAGVPDLMGDLPSDTANVVLTLARIWTTAATGRIVAKDQAADWALAQLPPEHQPVLARAREIYLGPVADERWDDLEPQVRPHCDYLVRQVGRQRAIRGLQPPLAGCSRPSRG